eukprot:TRINITY_DN148_c0_g1_i1.p1 TRINITY_DN148_c0_g1~~TRINITY_DN148_c0_g1_i1.p1  ORF type:complete len:607 (+),score=150.23 TRINITY_DN148_c0_g1_i1:330-2150(+)
MGACGGKSAKEADVDDDKPQKQEKTTTTQQQQQATQPPPKKEEPPDTDTEPDNRSDEEDEDLISLNEGIHDFYTFGRELGSGAYSIVYEAKNKKTGDVVAVKCIDLAILEAEATPGVDPLLPLKREIKIMKKVAHENVIRLFEVFVDEEKFYMVMELMPGEELFQRIERKGNYSEKQASRIFRQIVSAVRYLHEMGVAHRDLKPENILVCGEDENEVVKLLDFGFAKYFKEDQLKTALGSPGYAAPELFIAESYDESVDMWSLGVICYVLLSGTPPFYGETIKELTDKIVAAEFDFDDALWDSVSEAAKDLICHLLVKDPKKRYTAQQCWENRWVQGLQAGDNLLQLITGKKSAFPETKAEAIPSDSKYSVGAELGRFGDVSFYSGQNKSDASDQVIIQCFSGNLPNEFAKTFAKDVGVMKTVNHTFIAEVLDAFSKDSKYYIVYEWMPNAEDLSKRLKKKGALPEKEAVTIARQIISGIEYLHAYGYVHRHLRTDSYQIGMEDGSEIIKLSNLGCGKDINKGTTSAYSAPEGDTSDKSCDMYSAGVVIYELFTGSTDGVQDAKLDGGVWSSVSSDAKEVIRGCLNKDPKERWTAKRAKESAWLKL